MKFIIYIILALPVILGFFIGRIIEKKHMKDILLRENELKNLAWRNTGKLESFPDAYGVMVTGSVVIAQDAFKAFVANISFIFGGRVTPYESLIERARREAILRMKENAKSIGAHEIVHVRMETSSIGMSKPQGGSSSVEVFCYGTALKFQNF
jgi:uncharacterized protein YbjQ (UPF0145 family)